MVWFPSATLYLNNKVRSIKTLNGRKPIGFNINNGYSTALELFHRSKAWTAFELFHRSKKWTALELFHRSKKWTALELFHRLNKWTALELFHRSKITLLVCLPLRVTTAPLLLDSYFYPMLKKINKKNADKVYACINAEAYCLVYLQAGCCIVTMREYEGESVFCPIEH